MSSGKLSRRHRPAPPEPSQDELRRRRRARQRIEYTAAFSLSDEVAAICEPLAQRVAALPQPGSARARVGELADAAHELVSTIAGWIAQADAYAKTQHFAADSAKRRNAIRLLTELAQRQALPHVNDDDLTTGAWAASLTAMAQRHTAPLAEMLSRSHPPNADILRGQPSRSEGLERLLRETLDQAALSLQRYLERREHDRDSTPCRSPAAPKSADEIRAELQGMGITL